MDMAMDNIKSELTASDLFFDLEQEILRIWGLREDIEIFLQKYMDGPTPLSEDTVSNYLSSLMHMTELRCSKAFDTYEKYCAARREEKIDILEAAAQIVETEGLEPTASVPPEPLRARLARQIRNLKPKTYSFEINEADWDKHNDTF
jgi:hypothetical protein